MEIDKGRESLTFTKVLTNVGFLFPEYGKALLTEAYVTQVRLLWTSVVGVYSIYALTDTARSRNNSSTSPLSISGQALIDCRDAGILSRIETQP